jgi:hypothetical protein
MPPSFREIIDVSIKPQAHYSYVPVDSLEDKECFICKTEYEAIEDASEPPEHATHMQPCGHVVGHRCINEWFRRNGDRAPKCPMCSQEVKITPKTIPICAFVLAKVSTFMFVFSLYDGLVNSLLEDLRRNGYKIGKLNHTYRWKALDRTLSQVEAAQLFGIDMLFVFLVLAKVLISIIGACKVVEIVLALLSLLFGSRFISWTEEVIEFEVRVWAHAAGYGLVAMLLYAAILAVVVDESREK